MVMEKKYFSLGTDESSLFVKILRILFGAVCIGVAVFWLIFNIESLRADKMIWITIIFLTGFGSYQIWSGLGLAKRYIEIGAGCINLKKNPVLPPVKMTARNIERIKLYPLNLIIILKSKRRIMLRFGTTYYETNEKVTDEIISFAEINKITLEVIEEKI